MDFHHKRVWITGASSGIGEALTYAFVKEGAEVIISARREAELERVKGNCGDKASKVTVVPLDLTDQEGMKQKVSQVIAEKGSIDYLVNNGGISQRSWVWETPMEIDRKVMETNFFGQVAMTKALLPSMIEHGFGHIIVISSLTGKFGFPMRSAYAASKHALEGFFETLYFELADKNIRVTMVNPGFIRTQISVNAVTKDGSRSGQMDANQEKGMSPELCAAKILKGVKKNKKEIIIGGKETMLVYFKRFIPPLFLKLARSASPT